MSLSSFEDYLNSPSPFKVPSLLREEVNLKGFMSDSSLHIDVKPTEAESFICQKAVLSSSVFCTVSMLWLS